MSETCETKESASDFYIVVFFLAVIALVFYTLWDYRERTLASIEQDHKDAASHERAQDMATIHVDRVIAACAFDAAKRGLGREEAIQNCDLQPAHQPKETQHGH